MGIAMSMGLKMLTASLNNAAYNDTKTRQEAIKTALISFLRTNGRLPCPDNTAGVATGVEAAACTALATNGYGVVPWQTLGLSRDTAQDGWGNLFTYRVANFTPAIPPTVIAVGALTPPLLRLSAPSRQNWTSATANGPFDITSITNAAALPAHQTFLIQNRDPAPGPNAESRNAIVVLISHGQNGFGAKTVKVAARMPTGGAGADELLNATAASLTFVRRAVTQDPAAPGGAYDDVLTYMSPQDLLQPLVTEGTLKSCVGYCLPAFNPTCTTGVFSCTPPAGAVGVCASTGAAPTCTLGGIPSCTLGGTPQCLSPTPPAAGCVPATAPPVGTTPATCP